MNEHQEKQLVEVHVTFAAADKPYNHEYARTTTMSEVVRDALTSWGIPTDGTTRYYVQFDGAEQDGNTTLESLVESGAGHSHSLKLSLRTETISG